MLRSLKTIEKSDLMSLSVSYYIFYISYLNLSLQFIFKISSLFSSLTFIPAYFTIDS